MKQLKRIILPVTASALFFGQSACEKELTLTERLVGEWNIADADGDIEDILDDDYEIHLEFHLEGDFEFSMLEDGYKYSYLGEWEWANTEMTEIEMSIDESGMDINLKIDTFEGDVINGLLEFEYEGDSYDGDVVLERVYIDNKDLIEKSVSLDNEAISLKQQSKLRNFIKRNIKKE